MQLAPLGPDVFSAPQLMPQDFAELQAAGIVKVICNRPDMENPPELQSGVMAAAAKDAGLDFTYLPLDQSAMSVDTAIEQKALIATANGPVVAYCASGTRSTIMWAIGQAGDAGVDDILKTCADAGYPLEGLRPTLTALGQG